MDITCLFNVRLVPLHNSFKAPTKKCVRPLQIRVEDWLDCVSDRVKSVIRTTNHQLSWLYHVPGYSQAWLFLSPSFRSRSPGISSSSLHVCAPPLSAIFLLFPHEVARWLRGGAVERVRVTVLVLLEQELSHLAFCLLKGVGPTVEMSYSSPNSS